MARHAAWTVGVIHCLSGVVLGCSGDDTAPSGASASTGARDGSVSSGGGSSTGGSSGTGGTKGSGGATASGGAAGSGDGGKSGAGTGGSPVKIDGGTKECGGIAIPMGTGGPSIGTVGQWTDVTPAGVSLTLSDFGGDNYGAQDVLVDPVRPSDLYAFFCHQGVYKSTDYGVTWAKVNTGTNGGAIDSGKPWGEAIETNRCRDPRTLPTLYSAGSQGQFWRSTDGAVSWESFALPDDGKPRAQDAYDVDVDPYDSRHLVLGYHEEPGISESTDGGETWRALALPAGMNSGGSWYVFFIDTGDPATTRNTWLTIAQATGGNDGTWRTTDAGANWKRVDSNEHGHGQAQLFQTGGVVYMAGVYAEEGWGVLRSTDFAETWTHVGSTSGQNGVYGTGKFLYAQSGGASGGGIDQSQSERAPLPGGTDWSTWAVPVGNGPKRAAVTYDGAHYIVVGGNWLSGLWRYVEP